MKIFKMNLKRILSNKIRLAILVVVPILFISLFVFGAFNTVTIGLYDDDQSQLSKNIVDEFKKNQFYNIKIVSKDELINNTLDYQIDYAIYIENGFEKNFFDQNQVDIKEYYFIENENVMNAKTYLNSYINHLNQIKNSTTNKTDFYKVLSDFNHGELKVSNVNDNTAKIDQAIFSIGFSVYFIIFLSVITCGIIIEDRKNGTLERIFNAPISLKKYLFESLLSFIVVGFIQVTSLLLIFKYLFNFHYGPHFLSLYALVFVFSIVSVALGLLIISIIKSPIYAYLTIGVIASPLAMLGGCYWPLDMMPEWLQKVSLFIPTSWVMNGAKEIIVDQNGFIDILDNIGILLLFGAVFFAAGLIKKIDFAKA